MIPVYFFFTSLTATTIRSPPSKLRPPNVPEFARILPFKLSFCLLMGIPALACRKEISLTRRAERQKKNAQRSDLAESRREA